MFDKLSDLSNAIDGVEILTLHPDEMYSDKQVRTVFDEEYINELADSMENQGQLQPCKVYPKDSKGYKIHIGECRWRAAKLRGLTLQVVVDERLASMGGQEKKLSQLSENLQRNNLKPLEVAVTLKELADEFNLNNTELAKAVSKPPSYVTRHLALMDMPPIIREAVYEAQGVRDAETLYQLIKLWKKNKAAAEQLIINGMVTRRAVQEASKGDVVPLKQPEASSADPQEPEPEQEPAAGDKKKKKAPPKVWEVTISDDELVRLVVTEGDACLKAQYRFHVGGLELTDKQEVTSVQAAKAWAGDCIDEVLEVNQQLDEAKTRKIRAWMSNALLYQSETGEQGNQGGLGEDENSDDVITVEPGKVRLIGVYQGKGAVLVLTKVLKDDAMCVIQIEHTGEELTVPACEFKLMGVERV